MHLMMQHKVTNSKIINTMMVDLYKIFSPYCSIIYIPLKKMLSKTRIKANKSKYIIVYKLHLLSISLNCSTFKLIY